MKSQTLLFLTLTFFLLFMAGAFALSHSAWSNAFSLNKDQISVNPGKRIFNSFKFSADPNPFFGTVKLHLKSHLKLEGKITIFDLSGKKVWASNPLFLKAVNLKWNGTNSKGKHLPAGNYIVRFRTKQQIFSKRITLLR